MKDTFTDWVSRCPTSLTSEQQHYYMEMGLRFRVHAQLRKEGKSAFIAGRFVLRRRVRQRCHLQWTDSCRGAVGSQTLMDMDGP